MIHYMSILVIFDQAHSTDVVLSSLCTPRRWSGAGVGIKMLRGIPLLQNKKRFLGFWFLGFQKRFMLSKDIWYMLANCHFMFFDRYEIHIQAFGDVCYGKISFPDPHLRKI